MNGWSAQTRSYFSSRLYGLSEGAERTILVAILTSAILLDLRLVLDEGNHLDEYDQRRAIPAAYVADGGKEKARHDGGLSRVANH